MYGYENEAKAVACAGEMAERVDRNPTVGENIDSRIAALKAELKRLEDSKESLAPLMGMRIRDIRDAMNY